MFLNGISLELFLNVNSILRDVGAFSYKVLYTFLTVLKSNL